MEVTLTLKRHTPSMGLSHWKSANHYIGYFHGNLEYFTEGELIVIVEDMIDNEDDFYFNDMDDEVSDDDMDNGQWNFD